MAKKRNNTMRLKSKHQASKKGYKHIVHNSAKPSKKVIQDNYALAQEVIKNLDN